MHDRRASGRLQLASARALVPLLGYLRGLGVFSTLNGYWKRIPLAERERARKQRDDRGPSRASS